MTRQRTQQEILIAIGQRIAELRTATGLTQDSLSLLSGVDIQAIQRAERGRGALSFERLERLAGAVGVSLSALFDLAEPTSAVEWSVAEGQVIAAWRAVPKDRQALVVPLLRVLANG